MSYRTPPGARLLSRQVARQGEDVRALQRRAVRSPLTGLASLRVDAVEAAANAATSFTGPALLLSGMGSDPEANAFAWDSFIEGLNERGGEGWIPPTGTHQLAYAPRDLTNLAASIVGPGTGAFKLQPLFTGSALTVRTDPVSITQGGKVCGFTIDGSQAPDGAALHLGDIIGFEVSDMVLENYTAGDAFWLDNRAIWTERLWAPRIHLNNNLRSLRFSVNGGENSFAACRFPHLLVNVNAGQVGIYAEDNALFYGGEIAGFVNVVDDGTVAEMHGTANFARNRYAIYAEQTLGTGAMGRVLDAGTHFSGWGHWATPGMPDTDGNAATFANFVESLLLGNGEGQTSSGYNSLMADIASWVGSGTPVRPLAVSVGVREAPYSVYGHVRGAGIESPFTSCFNSPDNGFTMFKRPANDPDMIEVGHFDLDGGYRMLGNPLAAFAHHADGVRVEGKAMGSDGLGTGAWNYATAMGTLVRAEARYDDNGALLGYTPIFDTYS